MLYTFVMADKIIEKVEMYDEDILLGHADMDFVKARLKEGFVTKPGGDVVIKVTFMEVDDKVMITGYEGKTLAGKTIIIKEIELNKVQFIKTPPTNLTPEGKIKNRHEGFFIPAPNAEANAKAKAQYFGTRESSIWSAFDSQKYGTAAYEANMRRAMDGDDYNILGNPEVLNEPTDAETK